MKSNDPLKDLNNRQLLRCFVKVKYTDKHGREHERYFLMSFNMIYVLNKDKTRIITLLPPRERFIHYVERKKKAASAKKNVASAKKKAASAKKRASAKKKAASAKKTGFSKKKRQ